MKVEFMELNVTRRQFYKLMARLEADREEAARAAKYYEGREDEKERYAEALNEVRDLDVLIDALYEEG